MDNRPSDVRIWGYLWCSLCHSLAKELKDSSVKYEPHQMEHPDEKKLIVDFLNEKGVWKDIVVPIVMFKDDSFLMRPTVEKILQKLKE